MLGSREGVLPALTPVVLVPPLLRPKVPLIFSHRVPAPHGHRWCEHDIGLRL